MTPGLTGIVLAAGEGRRLGYPKAALELQGIWMLPRIVRALRTGGADRVILVLSEKSQAAIADRGPTGADAVVINPDPTSGRTSSILAGLGELIGDEAGLLIHPCDVPLLSGGAVAQIARAWMRAVNPAQCVARPATPAGKGGHPLLVGSGRITTLRSFGPDQSLRELVHADPAHLLNVTRTGDPGPFLDVNTPEQRELLENLLERTPAAESDQDDPGRD